MLDSLLRDNGLERTILTSFDFIWTNYLVNYTFPEPPPSTTNRENHLPKILHNQNTAHNFADKYKNKDNIIPNHKRDNRLIKTPSLPLYLYSSFKDLKIHLLYFQEENNSPLSHTCLDEKVTFPQSYFNLQGISTLRFHTLLIYSKVRGQSAMRFHLVSCPAKH